MKRIFLASASALALFALAACDGGAPPQQGDAGMDQTAPQSGAGVNQIEPTENQPATGTSPQ